MTKKETYGIRLESHIKDILISKDLEDSRDEIKNLLTICALDKEVCSELGLFDGTFHELLRIQFDSYNILAQAKNEWELSKEGMGLYWMLLDPEQYTGIYTKEGLLNRAICMRTIIDRKVRGVKKCTEDICIRLAALNGWDFIMMYTENDDYLWDVNTKDDDDENIRSNGSLLEDKMKAALEEFF